MPTPACRGPGESRLPWRVTAGVAVARLILLPTLMTALIVCCLWLRLFHVPDAMFLLILLVSNAAPTAINIQVGASTVGCKRQLAEPVVPAC